MANILILEDNPTFSARLKSFLTQWDLCEEIKIVEDLSEFFELPKYDIFDFFLEISFNIEHPLLGQNHKPALHHKILVFLQHKCMELVAIFGPISRDTLDLQSRFKQILPVHGQHAFYGVHECKLLGVSFRVKEFLSLGFLLLLCLQVLNTVELEPFLFVGLHVDLVAQCIACSRCCLCRHL